MNNRSDKLFHSIWSVGIVLCLILSVFALGFSACTKAEGKTDAPSSVSTGGKGGFVIETEPTEAPFDPETTAGSDDPTQSPEETVSTATPAASTRLTETADAGRKYLDRFIFLGDCTTYGIGVYYKLGYTDLCPASQVWTPSSGTLTLSYYNIATVVYPPTGEEITIVDAAERFKPEIMMITLGVNGISFMDEEWFIRDYTALVESIQAASPDTKIILNSIYPVAASYQHLADINNDKIRAANTWVEQIAEDTGCKFLNSFECLVGSDGYLPEEYQNGDGLHLTGEAFGIVMQYIRTHAYQ